MNCTNTNLTHPKNILPEEIFSRVSQPCALPPREEILLYRAQILRKLPLHHSAFAMPLLPLSQALYFPLFHRRPTAIDRCIYLTVNGRASANPSEPNQTPATDVRPRGSCASPHILYRYPAKRGVDQRAHTPRAARAMLPVVLFRETEYELVSLFRRVRSAVSLAWRSCTEGGTLPSSSLANLPPLRVRRLAIRDIWSTSSFPVEARSL